MSHRAYYAELSEWVTFCYSPPVTTTWRPFVLSGLFRPLKVSCPSCDRSAGGGNRPVLLLAFP